MSLRTLFAWGQAGGQEAIQGLTTAVAGAMPGTMAKAGTILDLQDMGKASDIVVRYRHDVETAQTEYDTLNQRYQTQVSTGNVLQADINGFKAVLADDNATAEAKSTAQTKLTEAEAALDRLVEKLSPMMPQLEHAQQVLERNKADLADAEKAIREHASASVNRVEETRDAQHDLERAQREVGRAQQREKDAKTLAGLATSGDESNPALAAIKRATEKLNDQASRSNVMADALHQASHHDEDDPVLADAMKRASGVAAAGSATDRFAALQASRA